MLSDLYISLTTPCPHYVRRLGYLDETIAMKSRYLRNREAWQPHIENTRGFVLSVAEKCRSRNKAVVFGAGLLLDVPLHELSKLFHEVVLVDIVFLPGVRSSVQRYGNVKLVQHDVTNMARQLYDNLLGGLRELPEPVPMHSPADEAGLVVSLNILSQLWVVPRTYALKNLPGLDEEHVDDWCRRTVEAHYAFLRSLACDACLVADHEFVKRDQSGDIVSRGSTVAGLRLPEPDASWTWHIMPTGENRRNFSKELIVGAWHLRNRAGRPGQKGRVGQ